MNLTKTQSMMSYNYTKMSYILLKNCPIILYFFRRKSVGTLQYMNALFKKKQVGSHQRQVTFFF